MLTTREVEPCWRRFDIDLGRYRARRVDHPFATASGAGRLFAGSGGVMEAAVRTAHRALTGARHEERPAGEDARGNEGVSHFTVTAAA